ncbi:unnamed protein product [Trichogramma brassicae]|uniref:Uncharacterized protein n=1 Tax=Trichogramma brassicae TaxID=86971 RepID=A0A6H5IKS8_9HYME|nr:unnamed protein product [Trichogramma brassicae]
MAKAGFSEQLQAFNYEERRKSTWLKNLKAKVQEAIKNQRDSTELKNAGLLEDKINIQLVLHRALINGQAKIIEFVVEAATAQGAKSIVDRNPIQNAVLLEQFESAYRCFDTRRGAFDIRYFSHFLIWYIVGSCRDDKIATEFVENFPAYRRSYGRLDRMSLLLMRSAVAFPDQLRLLKLLLESGSALPDFCRYHRRDTDASSFMQASLQLRERTKEVQRLLGGCCNCRGASAKEFMTLPAFHGFLHHSRKLTNLIAHRETQLNHLRDFLATQKSPCLKGAIHQVVLAFISPLFWEDNSHMLTDDAIGAQMVRLLVEGGCDPNDEDDSGISPLQLAVSYINYDVVKALLEAGADVKNITFDGGLFHCRSQCNLSVVKNLYDIVEILQDYGFRMNDFHQYQIMRFLVDADYSPLGLVMPMEGLIYHSDEKMRIYYNELVDVLSSKDITKLYSVMTQFKNIRKVLQIIEINNWYLDARRKKLLLECLSLIQNSPDMQARFRCCSVASEILEFQDPPVVNAKMSDGTKYCDFARYNYKRTVELFHGSDWREIREFFEETGRFRPDQELSYSLFRSKSESYRIIKAHILKSLKSEYLNVAAEMFWRKNSDIHYIHQAVPEVRDKIESNLDDGITTIKLQIGIVLTADINAAARERQWRLGTTRLEKKTYKKDFRLDESIKRFSSGSAQLAIHKTCSQKFEKKTLHKMKGVSSFAAVAGICVLFLYVAPSEACNEECSFELIKDEVVKILAKNRPGLSVRYQRRREKSQSHRRRHHHVAHHQTRRVRWGLPRQIQPGQDSRAESEVADESPTAATRRRPGEQPRRRGAGRDHLRGAQRQSQSVLRRVQVDSRQHDALKKNRDAQVMIFWIMNLPSFRC